MWSFRAQAPVERHVLRQIADVGQELLGAVGGPSEHPGRAGTGRRQSDEEPEQRRLARAVRAQEGGDPPGRDVQRAVLQRPQLPVLLAQPVGLDRQGRHATSTAVVLAQRLAQEGFHRLVVHALGPGGLHPLGQAAGQPDLCAGRRAVGTAGDEGPDPLAPLDEALVLELAVCLLHRVGVDGELRHHLLDRRQLITDIEDPHAHGLAHLLDELEVGRHARIGPSGGRSPLGAAVH